MSHSSECPAVSDDPPWWLENWAPVNVVIVHPLWDPFGLRDRDDAAKRAKDARERRCDRSSHRGLTTRK